MFPCEFCHYKGNKIEKVLARFETKHKECYKLKCWLCEKDSKTMEDLKKHIGTYHYTEEYPGEEN